MSDDVLETLSEPTRKVVMDKSIDGNQRFKALLEELYWAKELSTYKMAEKFNVKHQKTLWKIMEKLNIRRRNKVTAVQLASTGRYKYPKRDFDGGDTGKLKLWYLAHTDGSVWQHRQQVYVALGTPDPYLALLFKELFGKYGHVGVTPHRNNNGQYTWRLWVYLPLKSFQWLLEKKVPVIINEDKLYDALSVTIDAEGSINVQKQTRGRAAGFRVTLYNEKVCVIAPLQQTLTRLGYNLRTYKVPKGRSGPSGYGPYNSDYYSLTIYDKVNIKRLLERLKLALCHKRLKAYLIRYALSDPEKPVYWKDVEPLYTEIERLREEVFAESKRLAEVLHSKWCEVKELWRTGQIIRKQYEEIRSRFEAEAWEALETLKKRYDEKFSDLEGRIKARFRARRPSLIYVI